MKARKKRGSRTKLSIILAIMATVAIAGVLAYQSNLTTSSVEDSRNSNRTINYKPPEPEVSPRQPALTVGSLFPDFSVTEVDRRVITRDSLRGKPAIVWFTTAWCVPCQIGARLVSGLDNQLGGKAFNVLVIFVDLDERNPDMINWRKKFANDDWIVAFDNFDNRLTSLGRRVDLRFLDTKFILDKDGVIKNIDLKQADENYLNLIRQVVRENQ